MSDELTQAPEEIQDTPAADAAPEGTPAPDSEYTPDRARGLHAELTKAQQELAEVKSQRDLWGRAQQGDLDAMRELQLPVQFEDDEPEETEESDDQYSTLEQRIAAQEERDRQRAEQEGVERFNADLDKLASEKDLTLSKRERAAVYVETLQSGGSPEALQKVFSELVDDRKAYDKAVVDRYLESKRNAPFISPGGTGATEVPNLNDGPTRRQWITDRVNAAEAQ